MKTVACFAGLLLLSIGAVNADEPGFVSLFNGTDLAGWKMTTGRTATLKNFSVKDGVINFEGPKGGGHLHTEKTFQDFELRMEFRFVDKASDSGIFFRKYQVQTKPSASIKGLGEIRGGNKEVLDRKHDIDAVKKAMKPVGEWQTYTIIARGPHAEAWLNGVLVCTVEGLKELNAGSVGLQGEYGHLQFRNIRIKDLAESKR